MDFDVPTATGAFQGTFDVPVSKSMFQRALVLQTLADAPATLVQSGAAIEGTHGAGDDVVLLAQALDTLGGWREGAVGSGRASCRVSLGLGATGFRLILPVAALRPSGARTLVTGARGLRMRPHGALLRALASRGVGLKRRRSGAIRVHGGGYAGGRITLDPRVSSQFATALMLAAPRSTGVALRFTAACVMRPYLRITAHMLAQYGIETELEGLDRPGGCVRVAAGVPRATEVALEPDASAAAGLWAAAALAGASVLVPGLRRESIQADVALLGILERMGATITEEGAGVRVTGPGGRLRGAGDVELADATDLLPIVAALGAGAEGETRITGVAHARRKESDRVATSAAGIAALGGTAEIESDDVLRVCGGQLSGGAVRVAGDHRIAFAFGALGLVVPGVRLLGAGAVTKSHPGFLDDIARIAAG